MKLRLYIYTCFALLICFTSIAQQSISNKHRFAQYLSKPFLDSLRIVPASPTGNSTSFKLESVFPLPKDVKNTFDNFSCEGQFLPISPDSHQQGLTTEAISIFRDSRITLLYGAFTEKSESCQINTSYKFTSKAEVNKDGEKMIRQTLLLNLKDQKLFKQIHFIMLDTQVWPEGTTTDTDEILGYRSILFSNSEGEFQNQYMVKSSEGVTELVEFEKGSDVSMPEFSGGQVNLYEFIAENLIYPFDAWEEDIEGVVVLNLEIGKRGQIRNAEVISGHRLLEEEAVRLAWLTDGKWIPAKKNGVTIEGTTNFMVQFKLEDALLNLAEEDEYDWEDDDYGWDDYQDRKITFVWIICLFIVAFLISLGMLYVFIFKLSK